MTDSDFLRLFGNILITLAILGVPVMLIYLILRDAIFAHHPEEHIEQEPEKEIDNEKKFME